MKHTKILLDYCAKAFGIFERGSDSLNTDLVRKYCVDILVEAGYAIKDMSYEEIQKQLSLLENNIVKNGNDKHPNDHTVFYNWNHNLYNTAVRTNSIKADASTARYDPLVIDMGKTGFELTSVDDGVHFDMDSNGFAEKTGWITGDDAFLALDRNGDGTINDSGELFGDRTLLKDGSYASSGFEALAEFDDDLNGIINAHDTVYNQLLLEYKPQTIMTIFP